MRFYAGACHGHYAGCGLWAHGYARKEVAAGAAVYGNVQHPMTCYSSAKTHHGNAGSTHMPDYRNLTPLQQTKGYETINLDVATHLFVMKCVEYENRGRVERSGVRSPYLCKNRNHVRIYDIVLVEAFSSRTLAAAFLVQSATAMASAELARFSML